MILLPSQRRLHRVTLLAAVIAIAGCATPPAPPPASAPSPAPAVPEPAAPPAPAPVVDTPASLSAAEIQKALLQVLDLLQDGQEDQAEALLKRILQTEPNNRQALSLMRQIRDDPVAMLGRESFAYRVAAGESLSRIAQRFLNDVQLFYALARYNNIKVPRTLAGGQLIRVPGKAPAGGTAPSPAPAPAPAPVPAPAQAAPVAPPPPAAASGSAAAPTTAESQKAAEIARLTKLARAAFAKQDLKGARGHWDAVLALDPNNRTALIERPKVQGLIDRFENIKQPK